ncbi:MAG: AEC family transporter [Gammaproteobacteria bacterium]|nr:AEC family transporter [Gammaproteobacteria bacterium]MDH5735397.1 AEC family transporter [Gammaproteobacteria bacterium]
MIPTLLQMFALIALGLGWSWFNPGQMSSQTIRKVLTDIVYFIFLPALVLNVLWNASLGLDTLKISLSAAAGVIVSMLLSIYICRRCHTRPHIVGAVVLAAAFPNATYLGYPLLQNTLGQWAGPIAIQYDLLACTPLLLTVGIMLAARFGNKGEKPHPFFTLIKVPPLWAAAIAILLNLSQVQSPEWFQGLLSMMGSAVIPLMLIAIGLALKQGFGETRYLLTVIPVVIIQLFIMPVTVWGMSQLLNMGHELTVAVVLEGAMPSMALGVVLCDRYGLNTGVYAAAVTTTTLLSLFTLPFWFQLVQ